MATAPPPIVTLPACPVPRQLTPRFIDYSSIHSGPLGGQDQQVARLGSRMGLDVAYEPMVWSDARLFVARMMRAEATLIATRFQQPGFQPIAPGPVVVAGAQTANSNIGGVLNVRGATPGALLVEGQFLHIASQATGRRYIHNIEQDVQFSSTGLATLSLTPLMRFIPQDGDVLEFVNIFIEGFVQGSKKEWTVQYLTRYGLRFTLQEDR